ncbi:glycosyltransferase family 4 protein [Natroniella sp. ANB-PHB2]|uniref:glycosyltransferase family 4 protein n=1 Tax=Natroniella sp. ANB-PHB2 TaxID=3384444 RepID=UPI0038D37393
MKVLFLTQYCPPETGAPQNRIFELAQGLKKKGHEVTILTAMPNYPKGEIFEEYKDKILREEEYKGIRIIRTWIYATPSKKFIPKLLNYFSFTISSILLGVWKVGKQDVIFTESPPLFLGGSGYILSKLLGAKYIFNISDLWPESAVELGVLNNKLLIKLSTWLEEFCYKKADLISGQTKGIINNIKERGFDKNKLFLLTNGVDDNLFSRNKRSNQIRKELNIKDKFTIVYAGLHGLAQGLEVIVETAKRLKEYDDIEFVLIGDGPKKESLIKLAERYNLNNIKFVPLQPKEKIPKLIASMDATIIPLKKLDLFKGAVPSKMYEALASELPIILAIDGEARKIVEEAEAGIYVEPENVEEVTKAVLKLYQNRDLAREMGLNGRRYVEKFYARRTILNKFEKRLSVLMEK